MNAAADAAARPALLPVPTLGRNGTVLALFMGACLLVIFFSGLTLMVQWWGDRQEYSHGWLVPPIVAFLTWQRRDALRAVPFTGSWGGVALAGAGLALWAVGELSGVFTLIQYAFLVSVIGVTLAFIGAAAFRIVAAPMLLLLLMIPLPDFIYFNLSQQLQLLSSQVGVAFIRLCGISVYLAGNVIDLGDYKLQVVEACSGLRYLFPLLTLGCIVALLLRAPLWQRLLLVVSTLPVTVLMNSFRIAVVGVLVNAYGPAQAEGFLHLFEGWVVFMLCLVALLLEAWLLLRLSGGGTLRAALALDLPGPVSPGTRFVARPVPRQALVVTALLGLGAVAALLLPQRIEAVPVRTTLAQFPLQLGDWSGHTERLEEAIVAELKFTDYLLVNYQRSAGAPLNLYVAYYASQRKGESIHSPKACLPGGGWVVEEFGQRPVTGVRVADQPLTVNRALISHGSDRQLVYYWFQQRGRVMTNEYLVKWYLLQDSLTRHRSDGALVRLIVPLAAGETPEHADATLQEFARLLAPRLPAYVPG